MRMYNLLEYSDNYFMTSGSLSNYYEYEVNYNANENNVDNKKVNNNKTITSKSCEYKTKIIGSMPNSIDILNSEAAVPLKYLSNF